MNFPYVLSDEILLRSKYEKKKWKKIYVLSDCPSLYVTNAFVKYQKPRQSAPTTSTLDTL